MELRRAHAGVGAGRRRHGSSSNEWRPWSRASVFSLRSVSVAERGSWRHGPDGQVSGPDARPERTLEVAARVAMILDGLGVPSALIGAAALAVHGFPRATDNVDLAVATDPFTVLREAQQRITAALHVTARLVTPGADDPLGGVLSITGDDFDPVQVVNFLNTLATRPNPGEEAVRTAQPGIVTGTALRVVDLPHLVALKLYAGGYKSRLDVLALLDRNPGLDCDETARICARFGLDEAWRDLLAEMRG